MPSDQVVHALTFDVEDWYQGFLKRGIGGWEKHPSRESHIIERLLALLSEFNISATFFVLGKYAEVHPEVVSRIHSRRHEIATHGYLHLPIAQLGAKRFRDDLRRSLDLLGSITKEKIAGHRATSWSLTRESCWALDIMADEGLTYDSSAFPTRLHPYGFAGVTLGPHEITSPSGKRILEFPAQVLTIGGLRIPSAGGFYFRALPLWASRMALNQSQRRGRHGMVYLHPFDMDAEVPILESGPLFRIIRYHNLSRTEPYLRSLLKEFRFSSIRDILASSEPRIQGLPGDGRANNC